MKQLSMTLLLVAGLLFWGWSTQVLWLGMLLSTVVLVSFIFKRKYDFEASSFYQVANLGGLIVAAIFALYWLDNSVSKTMMPTLKLLPLALLPLLVMQYVSKQSKVPSSALLFFQRGSSQPMHSQPMQWFDVSVLFLFVCLLSAGGMPHEGILYFTGVSVLLLVLLMILSSHKQGASRILLIFVFLGAEMLGMGLVEGMHDLQGRLEAKINAWILSYNDGSKASTAIGSVGRLKLSDEIVFRVQTPQRLSAPILLREGTYQRYIRNTWYGGVWTDKEVPIVNASWQLMNTDQPLKSMTIYQSFDDKAQPLALPKGAALIANLAADGLHIKQGGRVEVQLPPPFAAFKVSYTNMDDNQQEIGRSDFDIPPSEAVSIAQFAKSLDLYRIKYEQGESKAVQVLHDYLWNHFTYSTWAKGNSSSHSDKTALSHFLWQSKAGHCEYFATATVLVLREIGIPARYAVGYSMSERDDDVYVVRGRDAHAWAVAFVDGQWVSVDNTPANWLTIEDEDSSAWQGVSDMLSSWVFAFKTWRYSDDEKNTTFWYWLLAVMFIFLAYRVLRRVKTLEPSQTNQSQVRDKDWLVLEQELADAGYIRHQGETVHAWFSRIRGGQWQAVAGLHDKHRYSKHGLNAVMQAVFERNKQQIRQILVEERS